MKKPKNEKQVESPGAAEMQAAKIAEVRVDESRGADAPVNRREDMSYEEAMKQHEAGTLRKAVLTPRGLVMPAQRGPIRRVA